ncbi:hypothetical protein GOODEAATRI_013743 [Goodea atripinnis]|uniref:ATPase AAA-type core domain-containing protein n=1 Tax=Goodea atripinnis TaxID=208336 RepID=A0ABV0PNC6_9TELE
MDYFSRKAPSSKEKSSPPQDLKENRQKSQSEEKHSNTEVGKKPSEKRGRKASRAARKLLPTEAVGSTNDPSCLIVEETQESKDSTVEGSNGTLGSNTAAVMSKLSVETRPEEKEAERSPCDVSMDVSLDETSLLNSSTVTISFEDFVRSQNKTEEDIEDDKGEEDDGKNLEKADELNDEPLDIPKAEDSVGPFQVSPRTLTIQAEVHAVSPKQNTVRAVGKVASIFTRKKGATSPAGSAASPTDDSRQLPSGSSTIKRRSNVVLEEEDLELAVIESESTPKCGLAERKQFMAAFKQPSLDGSKAKPVKSQSKQKQAEEKTVEAADKADEEEDVSVPSAEQGSQDSKASKGKSVKRGRSKAKAKPEAVNTSPAASTVKETEVTDEDEEEETPITSTPTVPALRRSRRETVVRKSPENTPTTPVRKTRRQKESKEATSPQVSPAKMSTPKTQRSRHGVFVVEMVCPPDASESPISRSHTQHNRLMGSVWTSGISESDRQLLMKEFCSKNPHFPAEMVFARLQKRCADHQQQLTASEWDCGEEDYQDAEDTLCNTMLITGPTGVGKTAAVYACAQELGFKVQLHHIQKMETYASQHLLPHFLIYPFKVFEVNASSQRSGRLILSQLKEATQSHQVDSQGVNAHKPTYFNSYGLTSSSSSSRPGSSPSMDDTVNQ